MLLRDIHWLYSVINIGIESINYCMVLNHENDGGEWHQIKDAVSREDQVNLCESKACSLGHPHGHHQTESEDILIEI